MRFLKTQRYPFVGKGQTFVNLVAVASGFGMLLIARSIVTSLMRQRVKFLNYPNMGLGNFGTRRSRQNCCKQWMAHYLGFHATHCGSHAKENRVDYGCAGYTNDTPFRFPIALQMLFGIVLAVMVVFLPESSRWLISRCYDDEAKEVLDRITPESPAGDASHDEVVDSLFQSIVTARELEKSAQSETSFAELWTGGKMKNWRRMALCAGIMAIQQLSGINLLTYYISYVLENSIGLSRHMSLLAGGFNGLEYLIASIIPMWTIEKIGRRKLLLFSASGQMVSMTILSAAIWYITEKKDDSANYAMGIVTVACFFPFNTCYAQGFLAIPFFYPAEITSLRTRSRGVSLSVMSNWIVTVLVVMITPISTTNIGWKTYVIFAVLNASFIPIIYFLVPETTGLSLEALDGILDHSGVITRGVLDKQLRRNMLQMSNRPQELLLEKVFDKEIRLDRPVKSTHVVEQVE